MKATTKRNCSLRHVNGITAAVFNGKKGKENNFTSHFQKEFGRKYPRE